MNHFYPSVKGRLFYGTTYKITTKTIDSTSKRTHSSLISSGLKHHPEIAVSSDCLRSAWPDMNGISGAKLLKTKQINVVKTNVIMRKKVR